jgi:hypothetical protein
MVILQSLKVFQSQMEKIEELKEKLIANNPFKNYEDVA